MARGEISLVHSILPSQADGRELFCVAVAVLTAATAQQQTAISRSNTWQIVFETAIEQNNEKHPKSVNEFRRGDESGH